jgi:hypothetical protein
MWCVPAPEAHDKSKLFAQEMTLTKPSYLLSLELRILLGNV